MSALCDLLSEACSPPGRNQTAIGRGSFSSVRTLAQAKCLSTYTIYRPLRDRQFYAAATNGSCLTSIVRPYLTTRAVFPRRLAAAYARFSQKM